MIEILIIFVLRVFTCHSATTNNGAGEKGGIYTYSPLQNEIKRKATSSLNMNVIQWVGN